MVKKLALLLATGGAAAGAEGAAGAAAGAGATGATAAAAAPAAPGFGTQLFNAWAAGKQGPLGLLAPPGQGQGGWAQARDTVLRMQQQRRREPMEPAIVGPAQRLLEQSGGQPDPQDAHRLQSLYR